MRNGFKESIDFSLDESQIDAWIDCYNVLKKELVGGLEHFNIVFEQVDITELKD